MLGEVLIIPSLHSRRNSGPFFTAAKGNHHPFDIGVGHSLGGVVAATLLPLLKSARPVRVVLGDPPLEVTPESIAFYRTFSVDSVRNPKTPEAYLQENPSWTNEAAIFTSLGARLCNVATMDAILDQNDPWSFSHYLSSFPDNVRVTVLATDPSKEPCVRVEDLKTYLHVTSRTVLGSSHTVPLEFPLVVVETALDGH